MVQEIRAFIAVELKNKTLLPALDKLQKELTEAVQPIKLVELENIHLTLKFLGNISELTASKIYRYLEDEINKNYFDNNTYEFDVKGLSDFRRNVFFVELNGPKKVLNEIHEKIDDFLFEEFRTFDRDKKFKIHITIARLKQKRFKGHRKDVADNKPDFSKYEQLKIKYRDINLGKWVVNKVVLKKSTLTPHGPIYENLEFDENDS